MKRKRPSDLMALLLGAIDGSDLREYNNTTAPSGSSTGEPEDADNEEELDAVPLSPPPRLRVLLIEDDIDVASILVRMLVALGHTVAGPIAQLYDAVEAAQKEPVDLAILDVDLYGQASSSVAEMLDARHIPFVVMTGYSADELFSPFRNRPTLQKPFRQRDLLLALEAARLSGSSDVPASMLGRAKHRSGEEALRESLAITAAILDAVPARIFWKDRNLIYLGCNAPFARDAGFSRPEDIIGKDDYEMGWRAQAEKYRSDDREVIASGHSMLLIDEPQTTPDGKTITLLTSKVPLRHPDGEVFGVLGTYLDVTERVELEEELKTRNAQFDAALNNMAQGLLMYDRNGKLVVSNMRFAEMFGVPWEEWKAVSLGASVE